MPAEGRSMAVAKPPLREKKSQQCAGFECPADGRSRAPIKSAHDGLLDPERIHQGADVLSHRRLLAIAERLPYQQDRDFGRYGRWRAAKRSDRVV